MMEAFELVKQLVLYALFMSGLFGLFLMFVRLIG
jgi:hypothetical protein